MSDTSKQQQRVRRAGERKEPRRRGGKGLLDHSLGIHAHAVGEGRVNLQQQHAIANLYATHPAMFLGQVSHDDNEADGCAAQCE